MKVAAFTLICLSIVLGLVNPQQAFEGETASPSQTSASTDAGANGLAQLAFAATKQH